MIDDKALLTICNELLPETESFLDLLLRFRSLPGYEGPAMEWTHEAFRDLADSCEKVPVPEDIIYDPDYQFRMDDRPYGGRPNLRVKLEGDGTGKSVIFNAHIDVVPPSVGQENPFQPHVRDGCIYGRGACDDKGQIAVMWTMLRAMKKLGIRPRGDVILHIVIEEETGGNGTLAMVRTGDMADCCINLDGGGGIFTSVRGAVWFTGTVYGRAGHSGSAQTTVSALKMAMEAMRIIEEYHEELLEKTHHDDPLFSDIPNPMPVTFGELSAGDWPAMAPQKAVFKGVFGLLTTPKEEVMSEITERVKTRGPKWLKENCEISFEYRHDLSRIDPDSAFPIILKDCYRAMDVDYDIKGFPASADTCFYTNIADIPAVLTGMGQVETAHTAYEHIRLADLATEAAVMLRFIREWCGLREG